MSTWELLNDITELKDAIFELQHKVHVMEHRLRGGDLGPSYQDKWDVLVCVFRNSGEPTTKVVSCSKGMSMLEFRDRSCVLVQRDRRLVSVVSGILLPPWKLATSQKVVPISTW